jgi:hypothetical protein
MTDTELERRLATDLKRMFEPDPASLDFEFSRPGEASSSRHRRLGRGSLALASAAGIAAAIATALVVANRLHIGSGASSNGGTSSRCPSRASHPSNGYGTRSLTGAEFELAKRIAHLEANRLLRSAPDKPDMWQCGVWSVVATVESQAEAKRSGALPTPNHCAVARVLVIRLIGNFNMTLSGVPGDTAAPAPNGEQIVTVAVDQETQGVCEVSATGSQLAALPNATVVYERS